MSFFLSCTTNIQCRYLTLLVKAGTCELLLKFFCLFLLIHSSDYKEQFENRDLKAFSAEPLLVYPTHYTGDPGYISDTETSTVWDNDEVRTDWDRARSGKTREQAELSSEAQNSDVLQSALDTAAARDELWEEMRESLKRNGSWDKPDALSVFSSFLNSITAGMWNHSFEEWLHLSNMTCKKGIRDILCLCFTLLGH